MELFKHTSIFIKIDFTILLHFFKKYMNVYINCADVMKSTKTKFNKLTVYSVAAMKKYFDKNRLQLKILQLFKVLYL